MTDTLIIGPGAVGTVLATYLLNGRRHVRIAIPPDDVDTYAACTELAVDRVTGRPTLTTSKPTLTTDPTPRPGEVALICVKYRDLPGLLDSLPERLADGVTLVPCQNGVGVAHMLRERFPDTPTVPMTVMFNARMLEPLHARITTKPEVLLTTSDKTLLNHLEAGGLEVHPAGDESAAWGKLLVNLANALCALTHTTFKDVLTDPDMTACFVAVLDEATAVLEDAGVPYRLPLPMSYRVYRALLVHGGPTIWWAAQMRIGLTDSAYPSMVIDVERGKQTEVDQLNGEIVALARTHGREAPLNARLAEMIKALEGQPQEYFLAPRALRERLEL